MMKRLAPVFLSVVLVAVSACKKEEEAKPAPAPAKPAPEPPKPAPEPPKPASNLVTKTNEKLKLSIDVPANAEMEDQTFSWPAFRANTEDFEDLLIQDLTTMNPNATMAEDKAHYEKDGECDFASWVKSEETPDGWILQYKCKGGDDKEYQKVVVRKKIGDKAIQCNAKVKDSAALDVATKSCQSLKPAG